jgi:hypothetical protein
VRLVASGVVPCAPIRESGALRPIPFGPVAPCCGWLRDHFRAPSPASVRTLRPGWAPAQASSDAAGGMAGAAKNRGAGARGPRVKARSSVSPVR